MISDAWIGLISICATVTLAVAGGAIRIWSKLEKLNVTVANLVTREQCAEHRKQCACGTAHRTGRKHK